MAEEQQGAAGTGGAVSPSPPTPRQPARLPVVTAEGLELGDGCTLRFADARSLHRWAFVAALACGSAAGEGGSGSGAGALADAASPAARPGPKGPAGVAKKAKKRKAPSRAGSAPPLPQPGAAAVVPQLAPPPPAAEVQEPAEGAVVYLQKSKKRPKKVRGA